MSGADVLPNPVFEGSEKRVEVHFMGQNGNVADGLRALPRSCLDRLMKLAACEIVSKMSNGHFDSYVLSESSLFVYPNAWVLKTCGTTRLLDCLPVCCFVLDSSNTIHMHGLFFPHLPSMMDAVDMLLLLQYNRSHQTSGA
jgi:hypothetical protein